MPKRPTERPPTAERSSDHGINSAQATPNGQSLQPGAVGSDVLAWHGRCSSGVAIGAISRPLAGGYARGQGLPHSKQDRCLQSGRRTRIVEQPRRISPVLHIGREALDKLARTTRGAHGSRPGQAVPGYRIAGRILRLVPREERGLTSRRDFRKASAKKAGCAGARSGIHCPDCVAAS